MSERISRYFSRLGDRARIKRSRYFDEAWYRATYTDVASAGVDAITHYLEHGAGEGRDPSWAFSTMAYSRRYPDVAASGENPLLHFLRIGRREGRDPSSPQTLRVEPPAPYKSETDVFQVFAHSIETISPRTVLEVGTLQAMAGRSSHSRGLFPWAADKDYVKLDLYPGPDVDVVGDIHELPAEWSERFGCFIANAVFEHLPRPWIAAKEVARILTPGGIFFISTHQTFPLHSYPSDYFRFSKDALRLLFEDAGLLVDAADYQHRCLIIPPECLLPPIISTVKYDDWNKTFPSFAVVQVAGRKPS